MKLRIKYSTKLIPTKKANKKAKENSHGILSIGCQFWIMSVNVSCGAGDSDRGGKVVVGPEGKLVFGVTVGKGIVGADGTFCLGGGADSSSESNRHSS